MVGRTFETYVRSLLLYLASAGTATARGADRGNVKEGVRRWDKKKRRATKKKRTTVLMTTVRSVFALGKEEGGRRQASLLSVSRSTSLAPSPFLLRTASSRGGRTPHCICVRPLSRRLLPTDGHCFAAALLLSRTKHLRARSTHSLCFLQRARAFPSPRYAVPAPLPVHRIAASSPRLRPIAEQDTGSDRRTTRCAPAWNHAEATAS